MRLTDVIGYVGRIKPHAFTDEDVTRWISEVEGLVCTEVFLIDPAEFHPYVLTASYTAEGMCFPETDMIRLKSPIPEEFSVGGLLKLNAGAGSMYAANSGSTKYRIEAISADGCEIRVRASFTATGREEDTADWTLSFDGSQTVLLVRPPHDKLYAAYVVAQIDFANGEYDKYNNTMQLFNGFWGEYCRWYSRTFRPADRDPSKTGAYLSAYAVAVKHGFYGTEEDWLASLHGADGSSGVWISDDLDDWPEPDRHLWILRDEEECESIVVPDGLAYADGTLVLKDGSADVGDPVAIPVILPDVTEDDNGAVLMVVNGEWKKVMPT
jgi:hypothetical protein